MRLSECPKNGTIAVLSHKGMLTIYNYLAASQVVQLQTDLLKKNGPYYKYTLLEHTKDGKILNLQNNVRGLAPGYFSYDSLKMITPPTKMKYASFQLFNAGKFMALSNDSISFFFNNSTKDSLIVHTSDFSLFDQDDLYFEFSSTGDSLFYMYDNIIHLLETRHFTELQKITGLANGSNLFRVAKNGKHIYLTDSKQYLYSLSFDSLQLTRLTSVPVSLSRSEGDLLQLSIVNENARRNPIVLVAPDSLQLKGDNKKAYLRRQFGL
jgi:hypothetical protein